MKLPKLAVENYQFVVVLVIMAVSLGVLSFQGMPRSEDPLLKVPFYNIVVVYPGTSPNDMEELIANKLEDEINEVEDIDKIITKIEDGLIVMRVDAETGVDIDDKYDELVTALNTAQQDFPDGVLSTNIRKFSPLDVVILQMAFVSEEASFVEMKTWAERLEDKIERLDGVRNAKIEAYPEEEVRIALNFGKMAAMNLSMNQVVGMLKSNNANIPGGNLNVGEQNFTLKTSGGYKTLAEIKNTVVTSNQGKIVYLKDIADVFLTYEDENYYGRFNQKRAIFLSVTQKEGKNILNITEEIEQILSGFQTQLPQSIKLYEAFKQAPAVEGRVNDFFANLLQGILLVGAIIFIFLGLRNALIIMTVIPTSILIAILVLDWTDFGLQQISIAGLVIALGLLVDNGIVVVENINRFLKEGKSLREAAIEGTSEVGWAIVSSTATTVLAFFPMTQLGGGVGEFLKSLPAIVIYALVASLLLALALTPLLSSLIMSKKTAQKLTFAEKAMQFFIKNVYRKVLQFSLKYPIVVLGISVGALVGSATLFEKVGVSFFPTADKPLLLIDIDTPEGTSLDKTDKAAKYVESVLDTTPLVKSYMTNVGRGNPRVYYNVTPKSLKKSHAQIVVNLEKWTSESFYNLIDKFRVQFENYPNAKIKIGELKNGPPYEAPIEIKVIGDDLTILKKISFEVEKIIVNTEGVINVNNPISVDKTNLKVAINKEKAGMIGLPISDIDLTVRTAITGNKIGTFNSEDGKEYDMVTRMSLSEAVSIKDFDRIYLSTVTGRQVALRQVAQLEFETSPTKIDHFNTERTTAVTADILDGYNTAVLTEAIIEQLKTIDLPEGYRFFIGGEYETQQESFGNLGSLLIIAVLGILAVLILQFKSFVQPFIVLSAIPFAFIGSIVALYLSGFSFSFFAFVGFTSLVGIVVNTSIIVVDYTNQLMASGLSKMEAIQQAAETRFTPIILTAFTSILGLLPLTLTNSNLWSPLGWTIIGGMISSTFLTVLIVPILYKWLTNSK